MICLIQRQAGLHQSLKNKIKFKSKLASTFRESRSVAQSCGVKAKVPSLFSLVGYSFNFYLKEQFHDTSMACYHKRCCFRSKQWSTNWFEIFEILSQKAKIFKMLPSTLLNSVHSIKILFTDQPKHAPSRMPLRVRPEPATGIYSAEIHFT